MRRTLLTLTFAALATALVNATESGTFAPGVSSATFTLDQGTISLKIKPDSDPNGTAYFRFLAPDGTSNWIQKFTQTGKCGYSVTAGNLVSVSATGGPVGYREAPSTYALGVNMNGNEGTGGCTQVNPGEALSLDFRTGLAGSFLNYASLDMELKYTSTLLTIKLYKDVPNVVSPTNIVYTYTRTCDVADCGPDSSGNDNYRINVPIAPQTVLFNRMVITATTNGGTQAGASLEGGSNPGALPSVFHVVTAGNPISCAGPITKTGNGTTATIQFLPDPVTGCPTNKTYVLNVDTHVIELLTGGSTDFIQTLVTVDWAPEPRNIPFPENLVSGPPWDIATRIATVLPPTLGEPEIWCDATLANQAVMPAGHTWCRIMQTTKTVANGMMQVTDTSLLQGDSKMIR